MFAWIMNRPVNFFGLVFGLPMVGLGSLAVQRSIGLGRTARICVIDAAVCVMAGVIGCGTQGPKYPSTRLEGIVTIDKKPLPDGSLQFIPQSSGQGPAISGLIKDGRYIAEGVPLGDVRVLFNAIRKTHPLPSKEPGYQKWATENLIPSQSRNGISIKVTAGQLSQNFSL